jgi:hypothetical protein
MLASQIPARIPLPFANSGTKNTIPTASQIGITAGAASLTDGFPPLTFTPLDAGGVPPAGADFNGVLNAITAVQQWQSAGGSFTFNTAFSTSIGGYPNGATLISTSGDTNWLSTVDNNTTDPDSAGSAGWISLDAYGIGAVTGLTNANVTLLPAQFGKTIITLSGPLTGNVQIIFPNSLNQWLVVNNTSGAFTVTCKTSSGTGAAVAQGTQQQFYGDGANLVPVFPNVAASAKSGLGLKNRLINGALKVDQYNAGASKTFTAAAALAYGVDRWYGYCSGANVTGQRVANTADQYVYQFSGAASVAGIGFGQRIEAVNCYDLAGKTANLSIDLANSILTTVTWTAYYAATTDTFGTLAAPTRTQFATGSLTVNSTLTRYNASMPVPAAATTGIEVVFTVGAQTSGTWQIGQVQLEAGSTASSFEVRPYGFELSLSQRYYEKIGGDTNGDLAISPGQYNGQSSYSTVFFKVTKRVAATIGIVGTWGGNSGNPYVNSTPGTTGFGVAAIASVTGGSNICSSTTSAYFTAAAEL